MSPSETGAAYDRIAPHWERDMEGSHYGLAFLRAAIGFAKRRGAALDVGCGGGRMVGALLGAGFAVTGIDVSTRMLERAQSRHPQADFRHADVSIWSPLRGYDLIVAWDSTFHLPIEFQEPVLRKLCAALEPDGVLLFTAGGVHGEVSGEMHGQKFDYASLSMKRNIDLLESEGCTVVRLEHDQNPSSHVVIIAARES